MDEATEQMFLARIAAYASTADLNPFGERCARCGEVAAGYAYIGDDRYCHPDDPGREDCYELAQCPTVGEMHGAFPDFTGGLDSVEYVRRGRER